MLAYILKKSISGVFGWELGLFVNDLDPDQDTVLADIEEPTWPGYTRFTLARSDWTDPVIDSDHAVSTWKTEPQIWLNDGSDSPTIFGAFMVDPTAGVLRLLQRFDPGDVRVLDPLGVVTYLPRVTLTTEDIP